MHNTLKATLQMTVFLTAAMALMGCTEDSDDHRVPVDIDLIPFHIAFAKADTAQLPQLKKKYPQLFPERYPDSVWIAKMTGQDTIQELLENAVEDQSFDLPKMEKEYERMFGHIKFYFPEFRPVDVVTIISEVDYRYRTIPSENMLLVALDTYLGEGNELYDGMYSYVRADMDPDLMLPDAALAYAELFVDPGRGRTFLSEMVYHGKLHYLQSKFVPWTEPYLWLSFTKEEYDFVRNAELQMYRYFTQNELLFSTDPNLATRFIRPGPFSKFYLGIDKQTPAGVGRYMGFQIVKAYMENTGASLDAMITTPAEEIFSQSNYKPKR